MVQTVQPGTLQGTVHAIPSKSDLHRILICAALADAPTSLLLHGKTVLSEDIRATINCLKAMGACIKEQETSIEVTPIQSRISFPVLSCGESGSTLRFLLPVAAAVCESPSFEGHGRLPDRPVDDLLNALKGGGISVSGEKLPFSFSGTLTSGCYSLPGNVSSQYITGLLLALPLLRGDSKICLTTKLESASYVDITLHALKRFGIKTERTEDGWSIPGGQQYKSPGRLSADGDWSNSGFFLVAGALTDLGKSVTVEGLDLTSPQGDKATLQVLQQFGAVVKPGPANALGLSNVTVSPGPLHACTVDLTDIPDSLPILAVLAANAEGTTRFTGGARLRLKESDRIHSVCQLITSLGGTAEELPDGLLVTGTATGKALRGGTVDSFRDHRIVMAAAVAAASCKEPVTVNGFEAVNKSYPSFGEDYQRLGGLL